LAVPADEKLVERTLAGDLSAFEALVQRHQAVVHRVAARIVGLSDADDVTQDTFLRAFHRLGQFGRDPAPASRGGGRRPPRGWRGVGFLRARKRIETVRVRESVTRAGEDLDLERLPVAADDPGGVLTLADGGLSIPIYEEEVVVTKRVVLKERVVIRKRIETHTTPVNTELRRELVEIDIDESLKDRVRVVDEEPGGAASG